MWMEMKYWLGGEWAAENSKSGWEGQTGPPRGHPEGLHYSHLTWPWKSLECDHHSARLGPPICWVWPQLSIRAGSTSVTPCDLKEKDIILNSCICKTTYLKHKHVNVDSCHYWQYSTSSHFFSQHSSPTWNQPKITFASFHTILPDGSLL